MIINYPHALENVPDCCMTQEMCKKTVDTYPFMLACVPNCYKTQEMCEKTAFKEPFLLKYCLGQYKSQEMCDKAVDVCLSSLKLVLIGLSRIRCLENLMMLYSLMMI